jgi:hypothetical protein
MNAEGTDLLIFLAVVGARLFVPLAIPRFPLPAIIAAMIIDGVDQTIFQQYTDLSLENYQGYDKALDIYYLSIAYLSTLRNWQHMLAFETSRFLYYYRLVGVVLFEASHTRWLLLVFPNTFEYFFDFIEGVRTRWNPLRMSKRLVLGGAAFIWIVIKLPQEYWIHVAQLDTTDLIKEDIFGVPTDTPWSDIISDNIGVFVALGIAIVLIIYGAWWYITHKLPPADWAFTFDVDAHQDDLTPERIQAAARARQAGIFNLDLLEKIVLVSLVTIIFAQMLPDVHASAVEMTIAVALLIVINAGLSELLARRGVGWESVFWEFMAMAVINGGIVLVIFWILPGGDDSINLGNTLFFLFLLTLLVVLYDRYRPHYIARRLALEVEESAGSPSDDREGPVSVQPSAPDDLRGTSRTPTG